MEIREINGEQVNPADRLQRRLILVVAAALRATATAEPGYRLAPPLRRVDLYINVL
jgi:hypothetical protein